MKTIAQLEAESNAASAARDVAATRLASLNELIRLVTKLEDIDLLTPADEADIASLRDRSIVRRDQLIAEVDYLEDVALAAAHALNDAPEEAA